MILVVNHGSNHTTGPSNTNTLVSVLRPPPPPSSAPLEGERSGAVNGEVSWMRAEEDAKEEDDDDEGEEEEEEDDSDDGMIVSVEGSGVSLALELEAVTEKELSVPVKGVCDKRSWDEVS